MEDDDDGGDGQAKTMEPGFATDDFSSNAG